ncbi:MAG: hypothetical protein K9M36_01130 [Candidatus Pacebacteria bacterium]|nr:hypothetical protein [Candidatus Paceibacterota bacterium]
MKNTIELFNSFSIPTRSIWSLLGFIAICGFGYLQFVHFLVPGFVEIFSYNDLDNPMDISTAWKLMWVPILTYTIAGTGMCLLINIFKKLKGSNKKGLIRGLIRGFIVGMISSLSFGLFLGLLMGSALIFVIALISGLFLGFFLGLTVFSFMKK